jgi:hypothetical protein
MTRSTFPWIHPALAACLWAVAFGLLSLSWAAGGELGISTLAHTIQDAAREGDDDMRLATAVTGALKIAAGLLALWTLRPVGGRRLRTVGLSLLWGCAFLFALYGLLGFFEKLLMGLGVLDVPDGLGEDVVWWYVFLWEPIWILGGVLFFMTAWLFGRLLRAERLA